MVSELGDLWVVGLVGVTMTIICSWPLYKGWQRRARYQLVRDAPTETPETANSGDTVLVTGTARKQDDSIHAPVSNTDGLLAAWRIREWQDESLKRKGWRPKARGLRSVPFLLEKGNGSVKREGRTNEVPTETETSLLGYDAVIGFDIDDVLVEVEGFETSIDRAQEEGPPSRIRELERSVGLEAPDDGRTLIDVGRTHGTRRYEETVIEAGDQLTVRGTITTPDEPGASPVLSPPESGPELHSTLSPDELAWRYRWSYWKLFYGSIGTILALMVFALLATGGS